ncbi:haloacid dehalogenase type II [Pseudoponticoccus marisrubri]|uniref:Haloacid dehalogenase n=1 Tax=Pseudoponticoccus marisrubri TaxID=1685382 RepID=A0A0W7WKF0_9RHOB|nr:haloacid dehalogenase type II [Pseudoponticoccus marisrubri]KUF11088.1 haloacid dehalogenase [Pseudoponticoccus marisrubri]
MKALLFDVFGTVVDWRGGVAREVATFCARHGITDVDPAAFADAWRARYQPAMEEVRAGRRPFVRLDVLHRENLDATLAAFDIEARRLDSVDLDELNRAWHRLDPWPDAVPGLKRLRQDHIIAPLSNGNVALLLNMAKRAGLPWDAILGAEVVAAYKPDPASYLRTVDLLGLAPEEVCMVAAHNDDLHAARACGLKTAFLPRPTEHGPGQCTDLAADSNWTWIAADLEDLADQLDAA